MDDNYQYGTSIEMTDSVAMVGAPFAKTSATVAAGAAYILEYDGDNDRWDNLGEIFPSDEVGDQCGTAVAFSEEYYLIGCPFADVLGKSFHFCLIFLQLGLLQNLHTLSSHLLIIRLIDRQNAGSVHIYKRTTLNRVQTLFPPNNDDSILGQFGSSISINDNVSCLRRLTPIERLTSVVSYSSPWSFILFSSL